MFERKAYAKLLAWKKESLGQTAMLIEGARRVGKTTLAKRFAAEEYSDSIYIDFSGANKELRDLFETNQGDIDTLLRMLQLYYTKALPERDAVIIFDEVQNFPKARELIKHLVADGRYDYIETGSLVSIKKNVQDIVIPSEEDRLSLDPLDFEEYLWAQDDKMLADEIKRSYNDRAALPQAIHGKCEMLFNEYMLVGGMPQAVSAFLEKKDFAACDKVKRRILALYLDDMGKFGGPDGRKACAIFNAVPGQLSAGSKRFKFSTLGKNARSRDYESAVMWLEDAHLINVCHRCTDPNVGYKFTEDEGNLKCYMADTGLLVSHAFADGENVLEVYKAIQFGKLSINKGMIAENVVAQQIRSNAERLFYYSWTEEPKDANRKSPLTREVDFLLARGTSSSLKPRVCPIEVKSTKRYSTTSLDDFHAKFKNRVGSEVVLHPKQMRVEGNRIYLPLYMSFCI